MDQMWSAKFLRLVPHLHNYGGAVAAAVMKRPDEEGAAPVTPPALPSPAPEQVPPPGARVIRANAAELKLSDIGDLFSIGNAHG